MRSRPLVGAGIAVAVWLALGFVLSLATTRVKNWFVMTDELYYERLAISIAQTGSLLPRLHGEVISNVNQLYPVLLSPLYGDGNVPASFAAAHRLNAFVIASAAIPVYLLARRVGLGSWLAVGTGALSVAVPWVVLASFLLTEAVAYPAFCWALLALVSAVERKTWVGDALALAAIVVAVLARTQFFVLLAALLVAVVAEAALTVAPRAVAGELWRTRRPLLLLYALLVAVVVAAAVTGSASRLLGSYSVTAENVQIDLNLLRLTFEHVGALALGLALLPFIVGVGWLVERIRPSASAAERAFALVGAATLVLVTIQVASFNQRFGAGLVKDRYLFYVGPIVLVGLAAAVASRSWPRWWALVVPAAVAAIGFLSLPLTRYEKLNVDTPVAMLNDGLLDLATSEKWARVLLLLVAVVAVQALLLARTLLPWRPVALAVGTLAALALPLETAYAFERLFRVDGTNGLPVTLDQGIVFSWVDRNVGPTGRVTVVKSPVGGSDWWAGQAYWWDVEFWNESAVETFADAPTRRPDQWAALFDPRTGDALDAPETEFALVHRSDVRFRLAGRQRVLDRDAYVFEAERPWRATWLTTGIYADGFTRPDTPAAITVFAEPAQTQPLRRFVSLIVSSPDPRESRPVRVTSNEGTWEEVIAPATSFERQVTVCVPAGGAGIVTVETPGVSAVYRDPSEAALTGEIDRPVGVLLRSIALADESVPVERCAA